MSNLPTGFHLVPEAEMEEGYEYNINQHRDGTPCRCGLFGPCVERLEEEEEDGADYRPAFYAPCAADGCENANEEHSHYCGVHRHLA